MCLAPASASGWTQGIGWNRWQGNLILRKERSQPPTEAQIAKQLNLLVKQFSNVSTSDDLKPLLNSRLGNTLNHWTPWFSYNHIVQIAAKNVVTQRASDSTHSLRILPVSFDLHKAVLNLDIIYMLDMLYCLVSLDLNQL